LGEKNEEVNGYDCSVKQPKPRTTKKRMNKDERKTFNKALTYHYLKQQGNGDELVEEMDRRLVKCITKDEDLADVGVIQQDSINEPETMSANHTLTAKYKKKDLDATR
jgi:hypothetical protein